MMTEERIIEVDLFIFGRSHMVFAEDRVKGLDILAEILKRENNDDFKKEYLNPWSELPLRLWGSATNTQREWRELYEKYPQGTLNQPKRKLSQRRIK